MLKHYKEDASTSEKIKLTIQDFNSFALGTSRISMIRVDKWFVGLLAAITIIPIILFSGLFTSYNPEVEGVKMTTIASSKLANHYSKKYIEQIGDVKSGEEVNVLCYNSQYGLYLVETLNGERGWVSHKVFGNEVIVCEDDNKDKVKVGERLLISSTDFNKLTAIDSSGKAHEFYWGNVIHTPAIGMKRYRIADSFTHNALKVNTAWMDEHFKEGTKLEDIENSFYGEPLTIDIQPNGAKVITYPYWVKNYKKGDEYKIVKVLYVNDAVVSYTLDKESSMDLFEEYLPLAEGVSSNMFVIRMRSSFFIEDAEFDSIEDIEKEAEGGTSLGIVGSILGFVLLILAVVLTFYLLSASIMLLPSIVQFVGYVKIFPNFVYRILIYVAIVFSMLFVFVTFCPHWVFGIILTIMTLRHIFKWSQWVDYNRCPSCKTMYSLETVGFSDEHRSYYDKVKYEVNNRTGDKREVGRDHRVVISITEYLHCVNCDGDFDLDHEEDREA